MLTLEVALQKIQQFRPEQRKQVIQFVEFLDNQAITAPELPSVDAETEFFSLAGIWENKDITVSSLRSEAWRETK